MGVYKYMYMRIRCVLWWVGHVYTSTCTSLQPLWSPMNWVLLVLVQVEVEVQEMLALSVPVTEWCWYVHVCGAHM